MSRVHPPGEPVPFSQPLPCANASSGFGGHVVSVGASQSSIVNGALTKWLMKLPPGVPGVESEHVAGSAARFTSLIFRQLYAFPASLTWVVCAASAFAVPFTPSQAP
jgi:hypothetical protein